MTKLFSLITANAWSNNSGAISKAKWYALVKDLLGSGFGGNNSGSPNRSIIVPSGVMKLATLPALTSSINVCGISSPVSSCKPKIWP